jgi:DNA polymerase-3 subunit epsilon
MTDVLAVLAYFNKIALEQAPGTIDACCAKLLKKPSLPSHLNQSEVERIPHQAGVYYFYDKDDRLLYVGK